MLSMRIRLEEIRGDRNLEDLALEIGVAGSTVQRWEKGAMAIPSFRLPAIARAYGCSIHDIFEDDEPANPGAEIVSIYNRIPADRRDEAKDILLVMAKTR